MAQRSGTRWPLPGITLHPGYGVLTLACMIGMYWASSRPELGLSGGDPLRQLATNLLHVPMYAGLTFCFQQALWRARVGHEVPWEVSAVTLLGVGSYAAFDEWHQSLVRGRHGSCGDFVLDLASIVAMLCILRLGARGEMDR